MTTSSPKNYNYLALRGAGVDDMEFVEQFNLDPAVAYTPRINDVMLEQTRQENVDFYQTQGLTKGEAESKAMKNMRDAQKDLKVLLAKKGML